MQTKERDSNMELLRIVSMLLILVHHFIVHCFYPDLFARDGDLNTYRFICVVINGFAFIGVNCFILISGYYGIRSKLKSLFNLYLVCAFYALIAILFKCFWADEHLSKSLLYFIFLPFSHSEWWFIKCYVALFLLSPVLNAAACKLGRREFVCSLIMLTVLNVYLGYYWHEHNTNGYNVLQFIYVYLIGAYLRKFPLKQLDKTRSILVYVSCAVLWSFFTILNIKWRVPHWGALYYNNPLVLMAAIGLFVFMSHVEIRSRGINVIASSVLAAYLIQDVQGGMIYHYAIALNRTFVLPLESVFLKTATMLFLVLIGSVFVLGLAFLMERIRLLLMRPIWRLYEFVSRRLAPLFQRFQALQS